MNNNSKNLIKFLYTKNKSKIFDLINNDVIQINVVKK